MELNFFSVNSLSHKILMNIIKDNYIIKYIYKIIINKIGIMHFFLLIRLLSVKFTDPRGQYLRGYKKTFFHPESLINGYLFSFFLYISGLFDFFI